MRKFKRLISSMLLICIVVTSVICLLPPIEFKAAITFTPIDYHGSDEFKNGIYIDPNINGFWEALNDKGKLYHVTDSGTIGYESVGSLNRFLSSDSDDGDLDDWNCNNNMTTRVDEDSDTPAYQKYITIMQSLDAKTQFTGHTRDWEYWRTFQFDSETDVKDYITKFANNGNDDGYVKFIYECSLYKADEYSWYIGCDYNTSNGLFYYYYHYMHRTASNSDEYATFMLVSDKLQSCESFGSPDAVHTSNDRIAKNLVIAFSQMTSTVNPDKNIFSLPFDDDATYNNFMWAYNSINNHLSCSDVLDNKINVTPNWNGQINLPSASSFNIGLNANNNNITDSVEINLGSPDWVNFSDESALAGEGPFIIKVEEDEDEVSLNKAIANLTACILNGASQSVNGELTTEQIKEKSKKMCSTEYYKDFIYLVFDGWASVLKEAIYNSNILSQFKEVADLEGLAGKSNYTILNGIIQFHLTCMVNNKSMPSRFKIGDTNYTFQSNGSDISGYADCTSMGELFRSSTITDMQRAYIATEYTLKIKSMNKENHTSRLTFLTQYHSSTVNSSYEMTGDPLITLAMQEEIQEQLKKYSESDLSSNGTATNVLKVANIATRYALVSSILNNELSGGDMGTIATVYNAMLDSMISKPFIYVEGQQDYWSVLPSTMNKFTGTSWKQLLFLNGNGETEAWNRLISVLFNIEYAASICAFSEQGESSGLTPKKLEEWFNDPNNTIKEEYPALITEVFNSGVNPKMDTVAAQNEQFSKNPVSINMLRAIIEIYDVCQYLGIPKGSWSEHIDSYLNIYEHNKAFFEALRLNPTIYNPAEVGQATVEEPLGKFFNIGNRKVTDQWVKGFAMSSLYVPMETNLYDAESIAFLNDPEWTSEFYYKYGFYRKALYVNTDSSAIVNEFVTGDKSSTKVATLKDLLNYDRDIILYVDDNFYNARDISSVIDKLDYTNIRAEANKDLGSDETNPSYSNSITGAFGELTDLNAASILKTDSNSYYSDVLAKKVTKFSVRNEEPLKESLMDVYVLSPDEILGNENAGIESALDADEYSVKQSYAVVSAVYRDAELYNTTLRAIATDNAIFKSSSAICSTPGTTAKDWRSIYNFYMLANLEAQMKNDVSSTLDLDAPIFCDLFGNIITESGLVIIPAASNATLCGDNWTPYNVGFSEYYNNGNRIPDGKFTDEFYTWLIGGKYAASSNPAINNTNTITQSEKTKAGGYFVYDRSGVFNLRTTSLTSNNLSAVIQWEALNKNSSIIQQLFYNHNYFENGMKLYSSTIVNMIVEVLRGAPIEYINYENEGLQGNINISKFGIYIAYKLEEITDALIPITNGSVMGGNSVITMPNLAFIEGIEVYMLYVYKITFAVMIVALAVSLYMDAVKNKLGIRSVVTFLITCVGVLVSFTVLPELVSWSYYSANKNLLADESGHIMMLNYVKELDGAEISVTEIRTPESQTDLYLKVGNFDVKWWNIVGDVLFDETIKTVTELYQKELEDNTLAGQAGVQLKADGLYVDIQDIYDSTAINYSPTNGVLTNTSLAYSQEGINYTDTVTSYVSPYYVFMDQLINCINEYNVNRKVSSLSWTVGANGHVLTYDVASPYLTSAEFLDEGYDILGMYRIFDYLNTSIPCPGYNFTDNDESKMKLSYWYTEYYSKEVADAKIKELYDYARDYIIINKNLLGKVPDEVFIKVFAMQLALKYNELFEVGLANSVEIMNVDTRDLLRFIVASPEQVYRNYSYSWARFAYEESGGFGVIFCAILLFLIWFTSYVKPALMIFILALLIINIVGRKLLFRKESRSIEGYLIGCACLCLCNYAYAIMLKLTMNVNSLGLGSVTALIAGILTQVIYIVSLWKIAEIEVKDWKNNGYNEFKNIAATVSSNVMHVSNLVSEKFHSSVNEAYKSAAPIRRAMSHLQPRTVSEMLERDEQRIANSEDNIN